jgi:hypothetical protein
MHAPGGIGTYNLSRRVAADLRLKPRGHCDRQNYTLTLGLELMYFFSEEYCDDAITRLVTSG